MPKVRPKGVARSAANRLPAKWLTILLTAAFLAATAAFGGLARAETEETELIALQPGEEYAGELLSITVQQAVLEEPDDDAPAEEPGQRHLSLLVTVKSHWNIPVGATESVLSAVTVPTVPGEPEQHETDDDNQAALVEEVLGQQDSQAEETGQTTARAFEVTVSRDDDGTLLPWLQPEVEVPLVLQWTVPDDLLRDGDPLQVVIHELEVFTYQIFTDESRLAPAEAVAELQLPVQDLQQQEAGR